MPRELVAQLVRQLQVTEEQAAGGMGAILTVVATRLTRQELENLADAIPGFSDILAKSPLFEPVVSPLIAMLSRWFGGLGVLRSVAPVFEQLRLPSDAIPKYLQVLRGFVKQQTSDEALRALEKSLR